MGEESITYRLSSDMLPVAKRATACRDFFASSAIGLELRTKEDVQPVAEVALTVLPEIRVAKASFSRFSIDRTAARIAADGKADFALTIVTRGACCGSQLGRETTVAPGGALLTTDGERATIDYSAGADVLVIAPSRMALTALVPNAEDCLASPIEDSPALRLLSGYAASIHQERSLGSAIGAVTATHLLDLTALALGAGRDAAALANGRGVRAARLAAVKKDIERNLNSPQLAIGAIAAHHGISPRYIGKLFAEEGTSFSDHVRERRLERARRMLADPRHGGMRIGTIAFESGFGDLSYFNRCFRSRFGMTPRDYRTATRNSA